MIGHKLIAAGACALVYVMFAIAVVKADRKPHSGGFISLQGMMSALVTLPVALPMEHWGRKIDFRSNLAASAAIVVCGLILFGLTFGGLTLVDYVWNWKPA